MKNIIDVRTNGQTQRASDEEVLFCFFVSIIDEEIERTSQKF